MSDNKKFIQIEHVRREDQRKTMETIKDDAQCPFCIENLTKYHKAPIIKEGKYWILTDNQWPYEKIKHQLLIIYKEHIEHLEELNPEAGKELLEFCIEESKKRNIPGGGLAMRFGSSPHGTYGNSVLHIHAHLIEPDLEALDESEAWKFKFGQPKNYKKKTK
jgi:diadenosine tetraphosphate (Ap4A) HIT family hydrolase